MIINSYNLRDDRHKIILNEKSIQTRIEPVFDLSESVKFGTSGPIKSEKYSSRMYVLPRSALNDKEYKIQIQQIRRELIY